MSNETVKPLYKVLNSERTQGNIEIDFTTAFTNLNKTNTSIYLLADSRITNTAHGMNLEEAKANAQYTALAVNNLHHLAEALEYVINNTGSIPIADKAKE